MRRSRGRTPRPGRPSVAELDALARRATFERDRYRCRRCQGEERLQWAHVFSRRYHSLRWDLDNLLTLCAGCHLWWHHQPVEAVAWWVGLVGEPVSARLRTVMKTPRRPDTNAIRLALQQQLADPRAA